MWNDLVDNVVQVGTLQNMSNDPNGEFPKTKIPTFSHGERVLLVVGTPSRDEFIRALANVVEAYDHAVGTGKYDMLYAAHVAEARKLLDTVLPKGPR